MIVIATRILSIGVQITGRSMLQDRAGTTIAPSWLQRLATTFRARLPRSSRPQEAQHILLRMGGPHLEYRLYELSDDAGASSLSARAQTRLPNPASDHEWKRLYSVLVGAEPATAQLL